MRTPLPTLALLAGLTIWALPDSPPLRYIGFGGQQTVSGSLHALELDGRFLLIDVGGFMGSEGPSPPWPEPLRPDRVEAVFLTHAHADHVGRLPQLLEAGYQGPIFMTGPTRELIDLTLGHHIHLVDMGVERFFHSRHTRNRSPVWVWLEGTETPGRRIAARNRVFVEARRMQLPDMGYILAPYARRRLADEFRARLDRQTVILEPGRVVPTGFAQAEFVLTSHLPGSVSLRLIVDDRVLVFSGDLGNDGNPLLPPNPAWAGPIDTLFVEATYSVDSTVDLAEEQRAFRERLGQLIRDGYRVVIPAFVMDRSQVILHQIAMAETEGHLRRGTPVRLFSPTAHAILERYEAWRRAIPSPDTRPYFSEAMAGAVFRPTGLHRARSGQPSQRLQHGQIGVTSSGMGDHASSRDAIGAFAGDPKTVFFLVGFQAEDTLGRELLTGGGGRGVITVDGQEHPLRARVEHTTAFSGHARPAGVERLFSPASPRRVFLVHSDGPAPDQLQARYRAAFGATVISPRPGEPHDLGPVDAPDEPPAAHRAPPANQGSVTAGPPTRPDPPPG